MGNAKVMGLLDTIEVSWEKPVGNLTGYLIRCFPKGNENSIQDITGMLNDFDTVCLQLHKRD